MCRIVPWSSFGGQGSKIEAITTVAGPAPVLGNVRALLRHDQGEAAARRAPLHQLHAGARAGAGGRGEHQAGLRQQHAELQGGGPGVGHVQARLHTLHSTVSTL